MTKLSAILLKSYFEANNLVVLHYLSIIHTTMVSHEALSVYLVGIDECHLLLGNI